MAERELPVSRKVELTETLDSQIMSYPSNSKEKTSNPVRPKPEKVVSSSVIRRKKPLTSRMKEKVLGDEGRSIAEYILKDVAGVALKNLVCDLFGWGGIAEMIVWGGRRGGRTTRGVAGRQYTQYGGYVSSGNGRPVNGQTPTPTQRVLSAGARARHDFDQIVIPVRAEANEILQWLIDATLDSGCATVADFYELAGIDTTHADVKYGWTDLRGVGISRVRDGWVLDLPRAVVLD